MEKHRRHSVLTFLLIVSMTASVFTFRYYTGKQAPIILTEAQAADIPAGITEETEVPEDEYMTEIKEGMLSDFLSESPLSEAAVLSGSNAHIESYLDSMLETDEAFEAEDTVSYALTDGCYRISLFGSEVFMSTEGDAEQVTLSKNTDALFAYFRIEGAGNGMYRLYAVSADNSMGLPIVADTDSGALRIADSESESTELYITSENSEDGTRYITVNNSGGVKVGVKNSADGQKITLASSWDSTLLLKWTFKIQPTLAAGGIELAMYPADMLYVTQDAFTNDSHINQNAVDIKTYVSSSIFAPFSGRIACVMPQYGNTVFLESLDKVMYADGTYDYMTVAFMHDNDISDIPLGRVLHQGEYFYDMGVAGVAVGDHVHISVFRGQYNESMALNGIVESSVFAENAFTVQSGIYVRDSGGIGWVWTADGE